MQLNLTSLIKKSKHKKYEWKKKSPGQPRFLSKCWLINLESSFRNGFIKNGVTNKFN